MSFDDKLKEESLLAFGKLTYETSTSPFGEAIAAFQEYIGLYPNSPRIEEAYNYLVSAFTELRNYQAALSALDRIKNRDPRLEAAFSEGCFLQGTGAFQQHAD